MREDGRASAAVTSFDVARHAGVSQSSVSLVLSGKDAGRVSPATAERIRQSVRALGYQLNAHARQLKTGRADAVALAVPNVDQPYFARVLLAAQRVAHHNGYTVTLLDSSGERSWADQLVRMIRGRQLDGAIVYAPTRSELASLSGALDSLVLVETRSPGAGLVDLDVEGGAELAVGHLVGLGHQRFVHFGAAYPRDTFRRRRTAVADTVARLGGHLAPASPTSTFDLDAATRVADRLLADLGTATAVVCDDDLLAAALIRACRRRGIRVPEDLSVTGFGDVPLSRYVSPELTTVRLPADAVGERAIAVLLARIAASDDRSNGDPGAAGPPDAPLPVELVVRASTTVPRPG
jgi:DNA-binding LacI/PurR family transcriptional regulator